MARVAVYEPWLDERDVQAVTRALRSGWIAGGPELTAFEERFAAYCGASEGVAVSNGTVALELALRALGVGRGDEVVCPSFTIISCALAIIRVGAQPVFVDADPHHWGPDLTATEAALTPRTRAILGVHLYGHPFDPGLIELAEARGIALLEDAAEAHGASVLVDGEWRRCGSLGSIGSFSLYANKVITSGEGGICVTDDTSLADRLRSLRNLCFVNERRFLHRDLGMNARLSNLAAALALSQLSRIEDIISAKRALMEGYRERLRGVPGLSWQAAAPWARPVPWMICCVLDDDQPLDAQELARRLAAKGIDSRPFFLGMHEQPALGSYAARGSFPVAERLARRGLYLPSSPQLPSATIDRVCDAVASALGARAAVHQAVGSAPEPDVFGPTHAKLYDRIYADKDYATEARLVLAAAARHGCSPARVVDFGCGTGRHLLELGRAGLHLTGIDPSPTMIDRTRTRLRAAGLDAELRVRAASSARLEPTADLALMLFAVLSYHEDASELVRALSNVRASLRDGGLFIADPWYGPAVLADPPAARSRSIELDGEGWVRRAIPEHDPRRQLVRVRYELRRVDDDQPVVRETHRMRYFFPRELEAMLHFAGFELLELSRFPDGAPLPEPPDEYPVLMVARAR